MIGKGYDHRRSHDHKSSRVQGLSLTQAQSIIEDLGPSWGHHVADDDRGAQSTIVEGRVTICRACASGITIDRLKPSTTEVDVGMCRARATEITSLVSKLWSYSGKIQSI